MAAVSEATHSQYLSLGSNHIQHWRTAPGRGHCGVGVAGGGAAAAAKKKKLLLLLKKMVMRKMMISSSLLLLLLL